MSYGGRFNAVCARPGRCCYGIWPDGMAVMDVDVMAWKVLIPTWICTQRLFFIWLRWLNSEPARLSKVWYGTYKIVLALEYLCFKQIVVRIFG